MNVYEILAVARKELLLLSRDLHGLLLLFAMPLGFILVMSLAMRDMYATNAGRPQDLAVIVHEEGPATDDLLDTLRGHAGYRIHVLSDTNREVAWRELDQGAYAFLVEVLPGLDDFARIKRTEDAGPVLRVTIPAQTTRPQGLALQGVLQEALSGVRLAVMMEDIARLDPDLASLSREQLMGLDAIAVDHLFGAEPGVMPSAVQQNVPAWLIFSIFFIVVPLSNTFINERQLGTLHRMRTMRIRPASLIVGKLLPYFAVNQVQVVLMLWTGVLIVPLLGGDRLELGHAWGGLVVMSMAVSWCALGYALLIAVLVRTPEQAVTMGGMGNILLAAIGGIMVPAFVMPDVMQLLSNISPMAWALQGFLDVLLRDGGWTMIRPQVLLLVGFGTVCMSGAISLYYRLR